MLFELLLTICDPFKKAGDCVDEGKQNLVVFKAFGVSPYDRLREHCTGVDTATQPLLNRSSTLKNKI